MSFICLSFNAQAKDKYYPEPPSPLVGVLQAIQESGKPTQFLHEYLFRFEEGKWSGAHYSYFDGKKSDEPSMGLPFDKDMQIYFDGKVLDSVLIKSKICLVPAEKLSASTKKISSKYKRTVTTSFRKPTDPESWKPLEIKKAPFTLKDIQEAWKNSPSKGEYALKVEKIYAPEDRSRFLVIGSIHQDFSAKAWLFRDSSGKWSVVEGHELIDIGDFNGDGKNEALFKGEYVPPQNTYELRDLQTFQLLGKVYSYAGEGGGDCYTLIGG